MLIKSMAQPYGKFSRKTDRATPAPPAEILVKIHGRHTLEQIAEQMQIMIARLQDHNIHGVQSFRIRCETLDDKARPMALWDAHGQPLAVLEIPAQEAAPPYRPGAARFTSEHDQRRISPAGPAHRREIAESSKPR